MRDTEEEEYLSNLVFEALSDLLEINFVLILLRVTLR